MTKKPLCLYSSKVKQMSSSDNVARSVDKNMFTAQGDLLVGAGSSSIVSLPVGSPGKTLSTQSSEPSGLKYIDVTFMFPGVIIAYPGSTLPQGFLWCDGTMYSASSYPNLADNIGGIYGRRLTDLCTGGAAISGGDADSKTNAFDDNLGTSWRSSQTGSSIADNAYIGYQFTEPVHIRHINCSNSAFADRSITSVLVQRSDNGSDWESVVGYYLSTVPYYTNYLYLPSSGASSYWRLLATVNLPTEESWAVVEIEMSEIITDFNVPDLRGRNMSGCGFQGGSYTSKPIGFFYGEESHVLSLNEIPNHSHSFPYTILGNSAAIYQLPPGTPGSMTYTGGLTSNLYVSLVGSSSGHNNVQPYVVANYIIRA